MSYVPDPLDTARPVLSDDAGTLPAELRAIKTQLVANKAAVESAQAELDAQGNIVSKDVYVSTALPDDLLGKDGDLWIQVEA